MLLAASDAGDTSMPGWLVETSWEEALTPCWAVDGQCGWQDGSSTAGWFLQGPWYGCWHR